MAKLLTDLIYYGFDNKRNTFLVGDLNFDASARNPLTEYLKKQTPKRKLNSGNIYEDETKEI